MTSWRSLAALTAAVTLAISASNVTAHPGHDHDEHDGVRTWTDKSGAFHVHGSFVSARKGSVQIRKADDSLLTLQLEQLSEPDQQWVREKLGEVRRLNLRQPGATEQATEQPTLLLAQREADDDARPRAGPAADAPEIAAAFEPFAKLKAIQYRWDDRYFYVESSGLPDHPLMIGITAWQQQVPLPQKYVGANAWMIPLHPVPARQPVSAKNNFLRGAIALAVNGIPIFNPLNNRGDDAFLFGELDEYGGHCGRGDDYHYHLAPVHLEKQVGQGKPVAYALDGYPIYGYGEADGSRAVGLDWLNGHKDAAGHYHYHATKTYPYLNGGFYGQVTERDGQVDPQPRAEPVREALPPLRGAKVVGFTSSKPNSYLLTYELSGRTGTVAYTIAASGAVAFQFTDPNGRTTSNTYEPRRRPPDGPREDRGPARPGAKRPPREDRPPRRDDAAPATVASPDDDRLPQLAVTSPAFEPDGKLPAEFTCDGQGISPPVAWRGAPAGTKCYALSLWHTAPDREKSYWVVYNIPAETASLAKNSRSVGSQGVNDMRRAAYEPMCSKGPGLKQYHITVFALSAEVKLPPAEVNRANLLKAIRDTTLAAGTLTFQYERSR